MRQRKKKKKKNVEIVAIEKARDYKTVKNLDCLLLKNENETDSEKKKKMKIKILSN